MYGLLDDCMPTENILHTSVGVSENEGWTPQIQMAIFINDV